MIRRLLAVLLLVAALAPSARAEEKKPNFAPLKGLSVEFWDRQGLFHLVNLDLIVEFDADGLKLPGKVRDRIVNDLSVIPWEEFNANNPAVVVKRTVLGIAQSDPDVGAHVKDVLVQTLLLR